MKRFAVALALLVCLASPSPAFMVESNDAPSSPKVVIDPGHGGKDCGAIGPGGVMEKDVTLSVGLKLAERLSAEGFEVVLTRTSDAFVSLEERTEMANAEKADIFISVHANSVTRRNVRGIETFFLSFDASDEEARRVAAFENSFATSETPELGANDDIKNILLDLTMTEAHHESSTLAEAIHTRLLRKTRTENRGVKQAPFVVLNGAAMPAVLVEIGFISNPAEERLLSGKKHQGELAGSIAEGVLEFRKTLVEEKGYLGLNYQ